MKWSVNSIEHLVPWHRASVHVCSFSPILNLCFADCSRWHWPFGYIRCLCIGQHRGCVFIQFHNWKPPGLLSVSSLNAMNGLKWNPLILSFHIHGNVWIYGPPVNVRTECGELSNSAKQQLWPNVQYVFQNVNYAISAPRGDVMRINMPTYTHTNNTCLIQYNLALKH